MRVSCSESRSCRPLIACRGTSCFTRSWSGDDTPSHWKGVCGCGTKFDASTIGWSSPRSADRTGRRDSSVNSGTPSRRMASAMSGDGVATRVVAVRFTTSSTSPPMERDGFCTSARIDSIFASRTPGVIGHTA